MRRLSPGALPLGISFQIISVEGEEEENRLEENVAFEECEPALPDQPDDTSENIANSTEETPLVDEQLNFGNQNKLLIF